MSDGQGGRLPDVFGAPGHVHFILDRALLHGDAAAARAMLKLVENNRTRHGRWLADKLRAVLDAAAEVKAHTGGRHEP